MGIYTRTGLGGDKFQGEGSGQTLGLLQGTANGVGRKPGVCSMLEAREGQVFGWHGGSQGQVLLQGQEECSVPWFVDTGM